MCWQRRSKRSNSSFLRVVQVIQTNQLKTMEIVGFKVLFTGVATGFIHLTISTFFFCSKLKMLLLFLPCAADYQSHTIRMKRWLPEIEQKIKYAFNVLKNENEAVQFLLNLGLTTHEIDLVLQHFLSNAELNMRKKDQFQKKENQERNPLSTQEQQLELIGFSQSVSGVFTQCLTR